MIAKVLGISQPAVYGVIKRNRKWVIIITWPPFTSLI
jgi:predicted transcriptional regulator